MGTLVAVTYNYKSSRAQKARLSLALKPWVIVFEIGTVLLFVSGIAVVFLGMVVGWPLISIALFLMMVGVWYHGELKDLKPENSGEPTIDGVLEVEILGKLHPEVSPYEMAVTLGTVSGSYFFASRFGLSGGFLQQLVSNNPQDMEVVWQEALKVQHELGIKTINAGILLTALTRQLPQEISLLAHLQLDDSDLIDGIRWYNRIQMLIEARKDANSRPGGIGRDWSFGWIPTLSRFGQNISEGSGNGAMRLVELDAHREALDRLIQSLGGNGSRSLALVGPTGVGKTEIVYALAGALMDSKSSLPSELKYHQVFLLDSSALISAAGGRGELEGLLTAVLNEAYAAKNIIICLDNAQVFFEEGVGSVDITNVLLPILQAGRLPIILTLDEQKFLQISSRSPELGNALNRIQVGAATQEETMAVMQDQVLSVEYKNKVSFMYQALKETYRLSERYIHDLAMPGQAVRLLESAAQFGEAGLVTARSVQQAIEGTIGVKVGVANDDTERDKLLNLETLIHERMIGQARAVTVVSDALRRARSGVRNQNRPIGTFLFLGPTGVGKTELAKSLAAVYFGDETKMVRLDMNEFVSVDDVRRLIADGAKDPGSLTAQVMKQPFSVVLLDEIEKAHSSVLTTLLQLLDEGILRDENNREVSFRDAIVIATSNAGADRIREFLDRGLQLESLQEQIVDGLIESKQFQPEFLNRFDEIVVFGPLSKEELVKVVNLIIASINKTLEVQKISVSVADDAKQYLVEAGYDPRLGARPMRRVVQKAVENIIAKAMLAKQVEAGGVVEISLQDVQAILEKTKTADAVAEGATNPPGVG